MSIISDAIDKYGVNELREIYSEKGRKGLADLTGLKYNSVGHLCESINVYNREEYLHQRDRIFNERWQGRNPFVEDNDLRWYLVGYFLGDGSLRSRRGRSYVSFSSSDEDFIKEMGSYFDNISWESRKGCFQFTTGNKDIVDFLRNIGMRERKSYNGCNIKFPHNELFWSFMRGLLDSDGYVRKAGSSNEITWWGHPTYMADIADYMNEKLIYRKQDNIVGISLHSREKLCKIIPLLYKNSIIKLERKYERCVQILNHYNIQMK